MTPVALFVYNRPIHTKKTVEALLKNEGVEKTDLYVFCDGPKGVRDKEAVKNVRNYIGSISGFASIKVIECEENLGLANSIIDGVTNVLLLHERIIVMEDDLVTSPYFLKFMNDGLEKFQNDERVISIHGYAFPLIGEVPNAYFLNGADCWGWATWRRGWALFNPDGQSLLNELQARSLIGRFNLDGAYDYARMLKNQISGKNDSWAVRWHASAFLAGKLTLHPGRSLVENIGNDDSGTHSSSSDAFNVQLNEGPITLDKLVVEENADVRELVKEFWIRNNETGGRLGKKMRKIFSRIDLVRFAKMLLPPIITTKMRFLLGYSNKFIGPMASWEEAKRISNGYENTAILDKVLSASKKVKSGDAVFERDSVLFDEIQYSWPVLTALLWMAMQNKNRHLHVIDFGGSLGSSFFQNRKFLQNISYLKWSIVEQKHYVKAGSEHIEHGPLRFYETVNDAAKDKPADIVLLSSVLQYLEEPFQTLEKISEIRPRTIVIDKAIINGLDINQIFVQQVPANIYKASYPVWSISRRRLLEFFELKDYQLIESFDSGDFAQIKSFGAEFQGFIFRHRGDL